MKRKPDTSVYVKRRRIRREVSQRNQRNLYNSSQRVISRKVRYPSNTLNEQETDKNMD